VTVVGARDPHGNVLLGARLAAESDLGMWERRLPMPTSGGALLVITLGIALHGPR
jgi:type II secretory pathway component PulL